MTRVDFYILSPQMPGDRYLLACRLTDKAYGQGHRIYLHTGSDGEIRHLDRLLWTFRDQSFIPHGLIGEADSGLTPVLLGAGQVPVGEEDVLINLAADVPDFFSRFARVVEIIDTDPDVRRFGRIRFRCYRDRGYSITTHELK